MSDSDLVDITVPMARFFREEDEQNPDQVIERRRKSALRLMENGFSRQEVTKLYGDVLDPAPRQHAAVEESHDVSQMAAFLRR